MEVIYLGRQSNIEPVCVALGFFDGFHIGHLTLFEKVDEVATKHNLKKGLFTFDIQPRNFLANVNDSYITSLEDKIEFAKAYSFDYVFVLEVSKEILDMPAKQFIESVLLNQNIKHIVCGYDYHFGKDKAGNVNMLLEYSDFIVDVVDKVSLDKNRVSSTDIKAGLERGDIESVNSMLSRSYQIRGIVIHGKQRGRLLGYPTANVDYKGYVLPKRGVYATSVLVDGCMYQGMTNIGINPTFGDIEHPSLEVYILDFNEDIYGKEITLYFKTRIRPEVQFASLDHLKQQLASDKQSVIQYFTNK